jgi:predicted metal-dependent hydrolase
VMAAVTTEGHPIRARRVKFDWDQTPLHWIPDDPATTHLINVLHLLLPAGEKWFVDVYRDALPLVTDDQLREAVKGFMGQESVHARAHAAVLDHLRAQGLDTTDYTRRIEFMFEKLLTTNIGPAFVRRALLRQRLAVIAAIEHFTCVLGNWILQAHALDDAGADAVMLDLLRWHGAEEVEHRSVAFDLYEHAGGPLLFARRVLTMVGVSLVMSGCWIAGVRFLMRHDPTLDHRRYRARDFVRAARQHRAPATELIAAVPRYLKRSHHPSNEGSLQVALDYLAASPAARAATA